MDWEKMQIREARDRLARGTDWQVNNESLSCSCSNQQRCWRFLPQQKRLKWEWREIDGERQVKNALTTIHMIRKQRDGSEMNKKGQSDRRFSNHSSSGHSSCHILLIYYNGQARVQLFISLWNCTRSPSSKTRRSIVNHWWGKEDAKFELGESCCRTEGGSWISTHQRLRFKWGYEQTNTKRWD